MSDSSSPYTGLSKSGGSPAPPIVVLSQMPTDGVRLHWKGIPSRRSRFGWSKRGPMFKTFRSWLADVLLTESQLWKNSEAEADAVSHRLKFLEARLSLIQMRHDKKNKGSN